MARLIGEGPFIQCSCGTTRAVLFSQKCPECHALILPVAHHVEFKEPAPLKPERDYSPRVDSAGIEWQVCDPYPTYFRIAENKAIVMRNEKSAPFPVDSRP